MSDTKDDCVTIHDLYEIKLTKPDYKLGTYEYWAPADFVKYCLSNENSRLHKYLQETSKWKNDSQKTAILKVGLTKNFDDESSKFMILNENLEFSDDLTFDQRTKFNEYSRMKIILKSNLKKKIIIGTAVGVGVVGLSAGAFFAAPVVLSAVGLGSAASAAAGAVAAVEGAAVAASASAVAVATDIAAPVAAATAPAVTSSVGRTVLNFTKGKLQDMALENAWDQGMKLIKSGVKDTAEQLAITDGNESSEKQSEIRMKKVREMTDKKKYSEWDLKMVNSWLELWGLEELKETFEKNKFQGPALQLMTIFVSDINLNDSSMLKDSFGNDQVEDLKAALICLETDGKAPDLSQVSLRHREGR